MIKTPDNHIDIINELCEIIKENDYIEDCMINDWGRYSNFDIFVYPVNQERSTTNKIKKIIKESISTLIKYSDDTHSKSVHFKVANTPVAVYRTNYGKREKVGYDRSFYSIDVDFLKDSDSLQAFTEYSGTLELA